MHLDSTEGKALVEHYHIRGFPSVVFVDQDSNEIDRIIGYLPPDEFLAELRRIQSNEGTIPDLINKTINDSNNFELWQTLAGKYEDRGELVLALEVWESTSEANIGNIKLANYKVIELKARIEQNSSGLQNYIANNLDSEFTPRAFGNIISIQRRSNDVEAESKTWLKYVNYMELKQIQSAGFYNSFAWRMSELEQNLDLALDKIRLGIKMVAEDDSSTLAGYMDTEAEILWKMGNIEEAVKVIEKCITLQPSDKYFIEQRDKFLK